MSPRRTPATRMTDAATTLLDSLDDLQRDAAMFDFAVDGERERWFYTPTDHGGLALAAMTSAQHRNTMRLIAAGLSRAGYVTAAAIMGLENVLDHTEGFVADFGRDRGRDPLLYWIAIFGSPDDAVWSWRFGGHHISLHFTIAHGEVSSTTPCFFGADPASSPLLGPHLHRPLGATEDLARELMHSLTAEQQAKGWLSLVAPVDLVGANRPTLADGDTTLELPLIWRGRLSDDLDAKMGAAHRAEVVKSGVTPAVLAAVSFSTSPKGVSATTFNNSQQEILHALLGTYVGRIADDLADAQMAQFDGDALGSLSFAWAGGIEVGEPHYYRIQGPKLFCEYDNTQRDANHVHTVWRDLEADFARDTLADHYARDHF
ncbi:DUF3500 domain-containing protein [Ilumatobacter sp.]|uniref:DUF3500 domain-containing protein n=1 Tax=Ilumatobacter sp. TaxID=1967498 RepID=UPI003C328D44